MGERERVRARKQLNLDVTSHELFDDVRSALREAPHLCQKRRRICQKKPMKEAYAARYLAAFQHRQRLHAVVCDITLRQRGARIRASIRAALLLYCYSVLLAATLERTPQPALALSLPVEDERAGADYNALAA